MVVGVLVALDVVFLIFVTAFPSTRLSLQDTEIGSNVNMQGIKNKEHFCEIFLVHFTFFLSFVDSGSLQGSGPMPLQQTFHLAQHLLCLQGHPPDHRNLSCVWDEESKNSSPEWLQADWYVCVWDCDLVSCTGCYWDIAGDVCGCVLCGGGDHGDAWKHRSTLPHLHTKGTYLHIAMCIGGGFRSNRKFPGKGFVPILEFYILHCIPRYYNSVLYFGTKI